jgi:hypothetical protein
VALEKRRADLFFETPDGPAQRGLGDVQGMRGPTEAAALDDRRKRLKLLEVVSHA